MKIILIKVSSLKTDKKLGSEKNKLDKNRRRRRADSLQYILTIRAVGRYCDLPCRYSCRGG